MLGIAPWRQRVMILFLAIFTFLIYSNTLNGPFVLDDRHNIRDNPHIRLSKPSLDAFIKAGVDSPSANRPLANISFALNYYFHQYDLAGYHLVNIVIHITTGILLFLFIQTTLGIYSLHAKHEEQQWIAFFTALIWLVHPLQIESVTYIVQRMTSMAAMFFLLTLWLYAHARLTKIKWRRWTLYAGCVLAAIFALSSKEIAAILPLFIFLYEWYFFQKCDVAWLKKRLLYATGILFLLGWISFFYLGPNALDVIISGYRDPDFTLIERVLTQFRVVFFYISLLLFPHPVRLNLDHDFSISHSLIDPVTTMLSFGAIIGMVGLAFYSARKNRLISFCILWYLGSLVIESSVIRLEIIFEHRMYLPSMFVILMMATLIYEYVKKPKWLKVMVLATIVLICSVWTYQRNSVWSNELDLWKDSLEKSPLKARPHYSLGMALAESGHLNESFYYFDKAVRLEPDNAYAHNNLGAAFYMKGNLKRAIYHFQMAIRMKPDCESCMKNLKTAVEESQERKKGRP